MMNPITFTISRDAKVAYFIIGYNDGAWTIKAETQVYSFLPESISFDGDITFGSSILSLSYRDKKPGDKDYPWLLLNRILTTGIEGVTFDRNSVDTSRQALDDFFQRIADAIGESEVV